jgi:hypothetical protein
MRRIHTSAPASAPASSDGARAAQLRYVLQGDLRALAVPAEAGLSFGSAASEADDAGVPAKHRRLGDYLLAHDLITVDELSAALSKQRERLAQGRPIALGELLVEQGRLSAHEIVRVLMLQHLDRLQEPATNAAPPLGELLVRAGFITADQLAAALTVQTEARQRGETIRLGEILIAAGVVTAKDLTTTLERQRRQGDDLHGLP